MKFAKRVCACAILLNLSCTTILSAESNKGDRTIVLHATRMLEIDTGRMVSPAEILIQGERIAAVGTSVQHPAGAELIDLGDTTLLPGLIDAHVHLFLHPGTEDLQTVE